MTEKRDQLIGIRFTKKEREVIESLAENRNITLTDFMREAVFSHITQLKDNVGNINVDFFMNKFDTMDNSISILKDSIKSMKKELNVYDLAKIKHNLLRTERELKYLENL